MADFYAARAGTNAGAPLDGFLTAVHIRTLDERLLQRLVDMALVELGGRMSALEQQRQRERAALAVVG